MRHARAVGGRNGRRGLRPAPEAGLLRLRKDLELFANLRPAICYPALADASSLKRDKVDGLDIMIVRELTGGVYFASPRPSPISVTPEARRRYQVYDTYEIERIAAVAFDLAASASGWSTPPTSAM